jgi:uncharacterized membrane protein
MIWCACIVLAPILVAEEGTQTTVAKPLYLFFGELCHQIPDRTLHIAGNPMAVCARCAGIYSGFLVGLLFFPLLTGFKPRSFSPRLLVLTAVAPMFADVVLEGLGVWMQDNMFRLGVGAWFGVLICLSILPQLTDAGERWLPSDSPLVRLLRKLVAA